MCIGLTSQQHAKYISGTVSFDSSPCCHTQTEFNERTRYCMFIHSWYANKETSGPSTDPKRLDVLQGSHWINTHQVIEMTWSGLEPRTSSTQNRCLNYYAIKPPALKTDVSTTTPSRPPLNRVPRYDISSTPLPGVLSALWWHFPRVLYSLLRYASRLLSITLLLTWRQCQRHIKRTLAQATKSPALVTCLCQNDETKDRYL